MVCANFKPDFPTEIIEEGKVKVLVPKLKAFVKLPSEYAPSKAPVFYNPVMELNRDVAVLAVQAYQTQTGRELSLCEPLSGCGLRGIRFAKEVRGVRKIVMSDINERAFRLASFNVRLNALEKQVTVKKTEANLILSSHSAPLKRFDVVDIDPFGSPVPFLDSAIRGLRDRGLLALTATDMASLCGVYPKACIRKYGGRPLRTEYCHELATRLLAGCLINVAAKHDVGVNIVFSHRGEHYIRIYAKIEYGARKADESIRNMGFILHCFKCFHREAARGLYEVDRSRKCSECGSSMSVAGPLWLGNLFDAVHCSMMAHEIESRMFKFQGKIEKMLALIKSETGAPVAYFVIDKICDALNLPVPSVRSVIKALEREGFRASLTHFNSRGIRSNVAAGRLTEIITELAGAVGR